ncbi:DUF11 domain-containing protein [Candidatus Binatia bacterium]|jgi:uncharacterized repeat protein (TIGR01451 family)|nr:DUF11 domain-containing protein [Candidatus Binatia bacterium]
MRFTTGLAGLFLTLALAGRALAAPLTDPADPAFGASPTVVDFESAAPGIYDAYSGGLTVATPAGDVNLVGARLAVTSTYSGQYNMTGQYVSNEGYLTRNVIITFPSAVSAFGFHMGLTAQPWDVIAYDAAGNVLETVSVPAIRGSSAGDFHGIASATPIAQAILVIGLPLQPGLQWVVVDDLRFATIGGTPRASLTIDRAGNGTGLVVSDPAGIDCATACSASFDAGTTVGLAATPDAGSFFGGWGGACTGGSASTALVLDTDAACSATFHLLSESADLGVSVAVNTTTPRVGRKLSFDVTVRNYGPKVAKSAVLRATLSGAVSAANAITASSGCVVSGTSVTCTLGDLGKGGKVRRTINVWPDAAGSIALSATGTSAAPDPNAANSSALVTAQVR